MPTEDKKGFISASDCRIDHKLGCKFKFVRCLETYIKNYETYNNERKETSFCKIKQVSDRKRQRAINLTSNKQPVSDSK